MCGSARSAERISRASPSFWNARDAVLLAARTRPSVDRFFSVVCRNVTNSYARKAAHVSTSTTPLVSRRIEISCWRIGLSRSAILGLPLRDDLGRPEQLGADRQLHPFRRGDVDSHPNLVSLGHQTDHPPALGEAGAVTHREDGPVLQTGENVLQAILFRRTHEQDMTGLHVIDRLIATDGERSAAYRLPPDGLVQVRTKRIVAQDTDDEGSGRVGKGAGGPVDKLREVEQEDGLDLILRRPRGLRPETRAARQQQDRTEEARADHRGRLQNCHSIRPYTPRSISCRAAGAPNSACR